MNPSPARFRFAFEHLLILVVLFFLLVYTYAYLIIVPYPGFYYNPNNGIIYAVYTQSNPETGLRIGDQWLRIGSMTWEDYQQFRGVPFAGIKRGELVPIEILRGGQSMTIQWKMPAFSGGNLLTRLINIWWLAYVFWFFGTLVALLVRPRDERWRLMLAFFYLTAVWIMAGAVSNTNIWRSPVLMRSIIWLCVPVYLRLHWHFPRPLRPIPAWLNASLYLLAVSLAAAEWLRRLPNSTYALGFLAAVLGSLVLLAMHAVAQPAQRREIRILAYGTGAAVLPPLVLAITNATNKTPWFGGVSILALYALPATYFYVLYRRQLGGLELRSNRYIALYLFFLLIGSLFILLVPMGLGIWKGPDAGLWVGLSASLLAAILTAWGYPRFVRWTERHLLGMPLPPTALAQAYSARITTSLEMDPLVALIRDELLPTLMVRQAALLRLAKNGDEARSYSAAPIFSLGISADDLPSPEQIPALLDQAGSPRPPAETVPSSPCPWARLALQLSIQGRPVGLCLLGKRDPDDLYAPTEIPTLQALMDQTALALENIDQARNLHALYQADIHRHETERRNLARELHDDVLRHLAELSMSAGESQSSPAFAGAYQAAADRIRQIISGLRPAMLNYGLYAGMQELADETAVQVGEEVSVELEVAPCPARYPEDAELHLYRIVQQACRNAAQHAHSTSIRITGLLEPGRVDLTVQDNGIGFAAGEALDLPGLLANEHFGLAGMFERAALVGAQVSIESGSQAGTRVRVRWEKTSKQ